VDGAAGGRAHAEVAEHLDACLSCRMEYEQHARLKELLRAMPDVSSRCDFVDRATDRVGASVKLWRAQTVPTGLACACALTVMIFATLVQMAFSPLLLDRLPWAFLVVGVVYSAWFYGFWAGMFAVAYATTATDYFFTYPHMSFLINTRATADQVALCLILSLLFAFLVTWLNPRLRRSAEAVHRSQVLR
jgi:K+-sensing histidine kinase KdpD